MQILLLISSIISALIFLNLITHFIKEVSKSNFKRRDFPLSIITIAYLVFSCLLLLFALEILKYTLSDIILIYSGKLFLESIAISLILFNQSKYKNVFLPYIAYLVILPLIFFGLIKTHFLIPVTLLIIILSFVSFSNIHKKLNQTPIIYAIASILAYLLIILNQDLIPLMILITSFLFLLFTRLFTRRLRESPPNFLENYKENSPIFQFLKHIVFIIILTNFVFIGTIGIHESGHALSSKFSNCENVRVMFSMGDTPHTISECPNEKSESLLLLGGPIFPLIIAILLFFSGGKFIKEIAIQIFSFNLIISYKDLITLGVSEAITTAIFLIGLASAVLSLGLLANSRTSHL